MDDVSCCNGCKQHEECKEAPVDVQSFYYQDVHSHEECMTEIDFVGNAAKKTKYRTFCFANGVYDKNQCDW